MFLSATIATKGDPAESQESGNVKTGEGGRKPDMPSNVIPLPSAERQDPGLDRWQPPKEVLWFGHPLTLFALSAELALSTPDRKPLVEDGCAGASRVVHAKFPRQ